jgi:hypothetical protein
MEPRLKTIALLTATVLSFALTTCSNPIDFIAAITDEVMAANDRYLEVISVTPASNAIEVNTWAPIVIVFDRQIDETTLSGSTITFLDDTQTPVTWAPEYNAATKSLRLMTTLGGNVTFTITVTNGVKGADGSAIRTPYSWAFTTKPSPSGTVTINDPNGYVNVASVTLTITKNVYAWKFRVCAANINGGPTFDPGDSDWDEVATPDSPLNAYPVTLLGTQGTNIVFIQFMDVSNNRSPEDGIFNDIIFDSVAPVLSSFTINAGAQNTSSTSVTLNNNVTDASPLLMRFQNTGGSWSTDQAYSSSRSWTLSSAKGYRVVNAVFTDYAGNTVSPSDGIIYGAPASVASLNTGPLGNVTVSWDTITGDAGTTYVRVYRRDYPTPGIYTYLGQTTVASSSLDVAVTQGQLYYFSTAIYNTSTDLGAYSSDSLGFTSNVTIIYNSGDSTDTTLATNLKTWLVTNLPAQYPASIFGAMPTWSVTLFPESLVSTTYSTANIVGGDPVIMTHSTSIYSSAGKSRNVTAHGHGVIGQGSGGARLIDTVSANFTAWGYSGATPTDIGWGASAVDGTGTYNGYTWTTGNNVWESPLYSTSIGYSPTLHNDFVQLGYENLPWVGVYDLNGSESHTDYFLYAKYDNATTSNYFPVARQNRFMQLGYTVLPTRPYTGRVLLINLVSRMAAY